MILLLVGAGPHLPELKKKAEELKVTEHVIFTGMIAPEEVGHYYQAGDLFVSASISETQGMTYAEALAGGIPLLCRRDGCLEQVVTDDENGWQLCTHICVDATGRGRERKSFPCDPAVLSVSRTAERVICNPFGIYSISG